MLGRRALKHREPRRKVMIWARVRAGASWSDACILNLSSRGMLVRASKAPSLGTYLEIRRGAHVMVARVVWTEADRFGVRTQESFCADELIHHPDGVGSMTIGSAPEGERRTAHRSGSAARHESSRWRGRAIEFGTFALVGMVAATLGLGAVDALLARPIAVVQTALGGR
jgi:hypothetical protein